MVSVCAGQIAAQASVALSSVPIPAQELGRRAVERLIARLARPGDEGVTGVELLAPALTVRDSSGPPPGLRN